MTPQTSLTLSCKRLFTLAVGTILITSLAPAFADDTTAPPPPIVDAPTMPIDNSPPAREAGAPSNEAPRVSPRHGRQAKKAKHNKASRKAKKAKKSKKHAKKKKHRNSDGY